jgi:uncharacterized protein YciI
MPGILAKLQKTFSILFITKLNDLLAERKSILEKHCQYMRACRKDESSEQREKRLAKIGSYKQLGKATSDESVEERNSRLEKHRERMRVLRKNESSEKAPRGGQTQNYWQCG